MFEKQKKTMPKHPIFCDMVQDKYHSNRSGFARRFSGLFRAANVLRQPNHTPARFSRLQATFLIVQVLATTEQ